MAVMELGKIRQLGSPVEFFHRPANLFVAAFIGSTPMNLLNGKVRDGKVQIGSTQIGVPTSVKSVAEGQEVVFGVRPEYVQVASAQSGGFTGVVKVLENLERTTLSLLIAMESWSVEQPQMEPSQNYN